MFTPLFMAMGDWLRKTTFLIVGFENIHLKVRVAGTTNAGVRASPSIELVGKPGFRDLYIGFESDAGVPQFLWVFDYRPENHVLLIVGGCTTYTKRCDLQEPRMQVFKLAPQLSWPGNQVFVI